MATQWIVAPFAWVLKYSSRDCRSLRTAPAHGSASNHLDRGTNREILVQGQKAAPQGWGWVLLSPQAAGFVDHKWIKSIVWKSRC